MRKDETMPMSPLDEEIVKILKQAERPLSTYEIAKKLKISWSTANLHCYKLKAMGVLKSKSVESKFGLKEKMVWWVR